MKVVGTPNTEQTRHPTQISTGTETMGQPATSAPASLSHYAQALAKNGQRSLPGTGDSLWLRSETLAMIRFPTFKMARPSLAEIRHVLWKAPAAVVSYVVDPDEHHPANTLLYVCQNQSYDIEKLSKPARRDVRRALRNLEIGAVDWRVVLDKGTRAFSDTVTRLGLSNNSPKDFRRRYGQFSRNPYHKVVGAWKEDSLVAFMTLIVVGDWVEIEGSFFSDAYKRFCPSNGLVHYVLDYYLAQCKFKTVSYGMRSVQEGDEKSGLHAYKTKVGFEARPAHRVFVVHPLLRLVVNRLMLKGINAALRVRPGDRRLRKAAGMLSALVESGRRLAVISGNGPGA